MAKRYTDTNKYKKPFVRSLPGAYKLLWDYLYHDCNHAGIWIVDFEIAQLYIGKDMPVNHKNALELFNKDEERIVEIDGEKKWFLRPFIYFQYGKLNPANRVHASVISELEKQGICPQTLILNKPLISPLQGAKDKDKEKDKDKDKDKDKEGGMGGEVSEYPKDFVGEVIQLFQIAYKEVRAEEYIITNDGKERTAAGKLLNLYKKRNPGVNTEATRDGMLYFFKQVCNINDEWMYKNMSLTLLYSKINEILTVLKDGKPKGYNGNSKGKQSPISDDFKKRLLERMLS